MEYNYSNNSKETIIVTSPTCVLCKKNNKIIVDRSKYESWDSGNLLIQDAFPVLNQDEREMIMTGIHSECWNKMFGKSTLRPETLDQ